MRQISEMQGLACLLLKPERMSCTQAVTLDSLLALITTADRTSHSLAQLPQFRVSRFFFERVCAGGSGMEGGWRAFSDGTDAGVLATRV